MELMTSWEEKGFKIGFQQGFQEGFRQGFQEGRQEGLQEGLQEGACELSLRQLERRFGKLSKRTQASLKRLSFEQLKSLADALLDFTDARALARSLREHTSGNGKTNRHQTKNPRHKSVRQAA